ncbi:hypothetical protein TNCV_5047521 [Trichonephila clavipes]|nr:hypothetical protein TNCV_5047521 [Trichonephila clavipes]
MLGRRIAARPRPPATVRNLEIALLEEWNSIPQSLIDNLIASMANRSQKSQESREQRLENDRIQPAPPRYKACPLICDVTTSREKSSIAYGASEVLIQHAVSRSLESNDSRERRLEDDRIRHAASRSLESDDSIE